MKKKINRVSVCAVAAAASLFTTSFSAMGAGAGGGGYLALVVDDVKKFAEAHPETITLTIRRK